MRPDRRLRLLCLLIASGMLLAAAPAAQAASVAYIDQGSVWLASLDGSQRAKLAGPVVNSAGETEPWLDVAQSDGGRIVAARNFPGRISRFSSFKIWEPDGSSTVEGALTAPPGQSIYIYPLGFDITADGSFIVYGYSNSAGCCPQTFDRGYYARSATNAVTDPIAINQTYPTSVGRRIVALNDSFDPSTVLVQQADSGNPFTPTFEPWLDVSGIPLDLRAVDVAATGTLVALGLEERSGSSVTAGKIAVFAAQGLDQSPVFPAAVDCFLPTAGVAAEPSIAPDAAHIAWEDEAGVRVAGVPTTQADPCVLPGPTVTISPTGKFPSIGGADIARFLPAPVAPPPVAGPPAVGTPGRAPGGSPSSPGGSAPEAAPSFSLSARPTAKALLSSTGLAVRVGVPRAGRVVATATVPAKRLGRKGAPVVVATGSTTARAAGTVTVRLRRTAVARRNARRLKGARVTIRITQGSRTTTKSTTLR